MDEDLENYMEEVLKCLSVQSKSQEKMSAPAPPPLLPPLLSFIVNSQQKEEENEFLNQMQDSFEEEEENQVVQEEEEEKEKENQFVEEEEENQIIDEKNIEEVKPTKVEEVTKETFNENLEVEENNEPQFTFPIVKIQEKVEQPTLPTSSTTSMEVVLLLKESPCESCMEQASTDSIATPLESFTPPPITTTTTTSTTMDVFPEKDDTPLEINNLVNTPIVHSSTMMDESIVTYLVNTLPVRISIAPAPEHEKKRKRNETREHCLIFLEEFKKTLNQYNNHLCEIIFENKEMNQENHSTEMDLFKEEEEEECGICLLELYDETPIVF
jgi:hypothetical protein